MITRGEEELNGLGKEGGTDLTPTWHMKSPTSGKRGFLGEPERGTKEDHETLKSRDEIGR